MSDDPKPLDLWRRLAAWRLTARYYAEGDPATPPSREEWLDLADTLVELFELMEEESDE
jgi:hypothetical protein